MSFMEEQLKRQFQAGDVIFQDGAPAQSMFIILEGQIEIAKVLGDHKTVLATLGKGSLFGEMAIINRQPRSATATAVAKSMLLEISRELFENRLEDVPKWMQSFFAIMSERLRTATKNQSILLTQGAGRQVVFLLSMLAAGETPDTMDKVILPWAKIVSTIAFILAFNDEQVVEVLNKLVAGGLLKNDRREKIGRVLVLEFPDKLHQLAAYCKECYLLEGGHLKELSPAFRVENEEELEFFLALDELRREQGGMDDYSSKALETKLSQKHKKPFQVYQRVIEGAISQGLLETFQPGESETAYRINDKESFNEKVGELMMLGEMQVLEQKIMA